MTTTNDQKTAAAKLATAKARLDAATTALDEQPIAGPGAPGDVREQVLAAEIDHAEAEVAHLEAVEAAIALGVAATARAYDLAPLRRELEPLASELVALRAREREIGDLVRARLDQATREREDAEARRLAIAPEGVPLPSVPVNLFRVLLEVERQRVAGERDVRAIGRAGEIDPIALNRMSDEQILDAAIAGTSGAPRLADARARRDAKARELEVLRRELRREAERTAKREAAQHRPGETLDQARPRLRSASARQI